MKKINKPLGFWTIMVMSSARDKVISIKIPKLLVYVTTLLVLGVSTALYFTYNQATDLQKDNTALVQKVETNESKYQELKAKHDSLVVSAQETVKKFTELSQLEAEMNQLMNDGSTQGMGGEQVEIEQLSLDQTNRTTNAELSKLQSIQNNIPTLVQNYKETLSELSKVKNELRIIPSIWPTDARRVTSPFGGRSDPFTRVTAFHNGLDIAGPYRTPIYATADGSVTLAGRNGGYGKSIEIVHSSEYKTVYGHMAKLLVEKGEKVKKGDPIGEMGSTGRSTGVHVHYELLRYGEPVDPMSYILNN